MEYTIDKLSVETLGLDDIQEAKKLLENVLEKIRMVRDTLEKAFSMEKEKKIRVAKKAHKKALEKTLVARAFSRKEVLKKENALKKVLVTRMSSSATMDVTDEFHFAWIALDKARQALKKAEKEVFEKKVPKVLNTRKRKLERILEMLSEVLDTEEKAMKA